MGFCGSFACSRTLTTAFDHSNCDTSEPLMFTYCRMRSRVGAVLRIQSGLPSSKSRPYAATTRGTSRSFWLPRSTSITVPRLSISSCEYVLFGSKLPSSRMIISWKMRSLSVLAGRAVSTAFARICARAASRINSINAVGVNGTFAIGSTGLSISIVFICVPVGRISGARSIARSAIMVIARCA